MKSRNAKEILKWAVLSAVFVFAAFAGREANGLQDVAPNPNAAEATVDGVHYKLFQVESNRKGEAHVVVEVQNTDDRDRRLPMELTLINVVFTGSAMSRVASTVDYRETLLDRKTAQAAVRVGATNRYPAALKDKPLLHRRDDSPRYMVRLKVNGKAVAAIDVRPGY
jgi:hypothetical protein